MVPFFHGNARRGRWWVSEALAWFAPFGNNRTLDLLMLPARVALPAFDGDPLSQAHLETLGM
jgi:hypothetical protein